MTETLRDELERDAARADHDSIEDGPAFARGVRYVLAALARSESPSPEGLRHRLLWPPHPVSQADDYRKSRREWAYAIAAEYVRLLATEQGRREWAHAIAAVSPPPSRVESPSPEGLTEKGLIREGIEAFRLTREYVDPTGELLPPIEGWSWFDWCQKAARFLAEQGEPTHD